MLHADQPQGLDIVASNNEPAKRANLKNGSSSTGSCGAWLDAMRQTTYPSDVNLTTGRHGAENYYVSQLLRLVYVLKPGQAWAVGPGATEASQLEKLYRTIPKQYECPAGLHKIKNGYKAGKSERDDAKVIYAVLMSAKGHISRFGWRPAPQNTPTDTRSSAPTPTVIGQASLPTGLQSQLDRAQITSISKSVASVPRLSNLQTGPMIKEEDSTTGAEKVLHGTQSGRITKSTQLKDKLYKAAQKVSSRPAIVLQEHSEVTTIRANCPFIKAEQRDKPTTTGTIFDSSMPSGTTFTAYAPHPVLPRLAPFTTFAKPIPTAESYPISSTVTFGNRIDQALLKMDKWIDSWLSGAIKTDTQEQADLAWESFEFCLNASDVHQDGERDNRTRSQQQGWAWQVARSRLPLDI